MTQTAVFRKTNLFSTNKGFFLSAKIYSDVKGNKCSCGGSFTGKETIKSKEVPCCDICGANPNKFRIMAKIIDINGNPKRITIRHCQMGDRLKDVFDCLSLLRRIKDEIKEGVFDVRNYESKDFQESLIYSNFYNKYIDLQKRREESGEITSATLIDKISLNKNHLMPFFKNIRISSITSIRINEFRDQYVGYSRKRDKALGELRVILRYAKRIGSIREIPEFDKISPSRERQSVLDIETCEKIIDEINNPYYKKVIRFLRIYPIRPGELRTLKYRDLDLIKRTLTISSHMSADKEIEGRKSSKKGEKLSTLTLPLTEDALDIINTLPIPINKNSYLFSGRGGKRLGDRTLNKYWNEAQERLGLERHDLYELKHARLFEIAEMTDGDLLKVRDSAGHSNIKTSMKYLKQGSDLKAVFNL